MYSSFPLPQKHHFQFQFDQERQTKNHSVDENPKCAKTAEKVVNSAVRVKEKTFWLTYSCICYRSNGALLKMVVKGILWYLFALLFAYMWKDCPVITDYSCSFEQDSKITKAMHQTKSVPSGSPARTVPRILQRVNYKIWSSHLQKHKIWLLIGSTVWHEFWY